MKGCWLVCVFSLAGCLCPERAGIIGLEAGWKVIGPEYRQYVESDPKLQPDSKADRLKTAEIMDRLFAEAGKAR